MARKTKESKRIDALVEAAFDRHGCNIQFNVMDLGEIHRAGVNALANGQDLDEAMKVAITQYRL